MAIYARFNSINYKLQNRPTLTFSSRETTFTNIIIDFSGKTANDLPTKYQEIQIIDVDTIDTVPTTNDILYYGYCSQPTLPKFQNSNEKILLEIELLSPQTYLTKRTTTQTINKINIHDAVETIINDIITYDGFIISENDLPKDEYLSDIFLNQTIEKILSNLGYRFNFIWYVDELKYIHFRYLPNINDESSILDIKDFSNKYLKSIQPTFEVADYCNKLNISNVDLISNQELVPSATVLTQDTNYSFSYPFSISENVLFRFDYPFDELNPNINYAFWLSTTESDNFLIEVNYSTKTITYSDEIGFLGEDDDNSSKYILLQRDSSNTNLITGFKWNSSTSKTVSSTIGCFSNSSIIPFNAVYLDPVEINNNSSKINTSGIIEKNIDVNNKYYNYNELTSYAKSLFRQNNKQANIITLEFQGDINDNDFISLKNSLELTKKIYANVPNYFITENNYAITDIEYQINNNIGNLSISARSSNLSENFVDIFRLSDTQENEDSLTNNLTSIYIQDDKTIVKNEIIVNGEIVNL